MRYLSENSFVPMYGIDICISKRMKIFKMTSGKDIRLIEGDSKDQNVIDKVKEPIELLFIDGDHTYGGVYADITNWIPKVRDGGYIILHDVFGEQVNAEHECPDVLKAITDVFGNCEMFKKCNKFGFLKEHWSRVDTCMILQK